MWVNRTVTLRARPRGVHLITREVRDAMPELADVGVGLLHVLIRHTSASLALQENASPEVGRDLRDWLDRVAPEGPEYEHSLEGADDMPAHLKSVLTGPDLLLPVAEGRLDLGTWQGVHLCEHRDAGGPRSLTLTLQGEPR